MPRINLLPHREAHRKHVKLTFLVSLGGAAIAAGVTAFFDETLVSGDIGLAKPDPAVYGFAASRLGVEPAACLMIDDQMRNIEGARTAGLRTHFFEHARLPDLLTRLRADGALA